MNDQVIGFIGGGNMAASLIGGLVAGGYDKNLIWVSDPIKEKLGFLKNEFGVNVSANNHDVVEQTSVLVLAVKPQIVSSVVKGISDVVMGTKPLLVSIVAGIREADIEIWCGGPVSLVRCMPNTPALVRSGATALHANAMASEAERDIAESILRSVGLTVWVDSEGALDTVTALSGSGPAYYFLLMEAMEQAAIDLGLDAQTARILIQQTAFGAAKMALEVDESPADLRRDVTSPGGTTEQGIKTFEEGGIRRLVAKVLSAAKQRSVELSNELGEN